MPYLYQYKVGIITATAKSEYKPMNTHAERGKINIIDVVEINQYELESVNLNDLIVLYFPEEGTDCA